MRKSNVLMHLDWRQPPWVGGCRPPHPPRLSRGCAPRAPCRGRAFAPKKRFSDLPDGRVCQELKPGHASGCYSRGGEGVEPAELRLAPAGSGGWVVVAIKTGAILQRKAQVSYVSISAFLCVAHLIGGVVVDKYGRERCAQPQWAYRAAQRVSPAYQLFR